MNQQLFAFIRPESFCLCKRNKLSCRLSKLPLWFLQINLHNLFPAVISGIDHKSRSQNLPFCCLQTDAQGEVRVGKAEAKRILHAVPGKGFKIAISDINIFFVPVLPVVSIVCRRRIIADRICNRIRKLAAGGNSSRQDIGNSVSALLASLPYIHHRRRLKFIHPLHVHDVADIKQYNCAGKRRANLPQEVSLCLRQKPASFRLAVVLVLTGGPSDHNQSGIISLCRLHSKTLRQLHLLLIPGLLRPARSGVEGMILQPALIGLQNLFIQRQRLLVFQCTQNICDIRRIHHSARARSALVVIELAASEHRNLLLLLQRKSFIFVSKKHTALRRCSSRDICICLPIKTVLHLIPPIFIYKKLLSFRTGAHILQVRSELLLDVRKDCKVTCSLDGNGQLTLMSCAGTGNSSGKDLSALRDVLAQLCCILVINRIIFSAEYADLFLSMECPFALKRLAACSLSKSHNILQFSSGSYTGFTIAMTTRSNGLNQLNGSSSSMPSGIFINPSMALDAGAASFPCAAAGVFPLSAPV